MHASLVCVLCIWFTVQYHVMFTCLCTCIHALSINQHRWKVGYTGFFCRSQTNIQRRGLACWLGTSHLVVDCPAACNVHSGARPSCSLQAENQISWLERNTQPFFTCTEELDSSHYGFFELTAQVPADIPRLNCMGASDQDVSTVWTVLLPTLYWNCVSSFMLCYFKLNSLFFKETSKINLGFQDSCSDPIQCQVLIK